LVDVYDVKTGLEFKLGLELGLALGSFPEPIPHVSHAFLAQQQPTLPTASRSIDDIDAILSLNTSLNAFLSSYLGITLNMRSQQVQNQHN